MDESLRIPEKDRAIAWNAEQERKKRMMALHVLMWHLEDHMWVRVRCAGLEIYTGPVGEAGGKIPEQIRLAPVGKCTVMNRTVTWESPYEGVPTKVAEHIPCLWIELEKERDDGE